MATLTLVIGLPGVGKSTVARLLAEKTRTVTLTSDTIRRELFPNKRDYSSKETQAVIKETEKRARNFLKEGKNVILDALFTKQKPRDYYKKFAESLGANFKIVLVTTKEEVIQERLEARKQKGDSSEANFAYYLDRKPHFEPIQGEHITIDNSNDLDTLEVQLNTIKS